MSKTTSLIYLFCGVVAGVALVVACGDDSPTDVDAADAACNCPAAEPPLAGRITRVRADNNLSPGSGGLAAVSCPAGALAIGGSCEIATTDTSVVLLSSRFVAEGYRCDWSTVNATMARTGTAEVVCLTPAP